MHITEIYLSMFYVTVEQYTWRVDFSDNVKFINTTACNSPFKYSFSDKEQVHIS